MWLFMRARRWSFGFGSFDLKLGVVGALTGCFGVLWCSGTMLEAGLGLCKEQSSCISNVRHVDS